QAAGMAQIHEIAPRNTIYQWHLGDAKAVEVAFASAKHVTRLDIVNNRLVPNAMEPRAAIGEYDAGSESFTLWNTTQNPHVARLLLGADLSLRHAVVRPVRDSGDLLRGRRGLHQHRAGRCLSRRRAAGGHLRGRAAGRGRRARAWCRARRAAPEELHQKFP